MTATSDRLRAWIRSLLAGADAAVATAAIWHLVVAAVIAVERSTATWVVVTWTLSVLLAPVLVGAGVARCVFVHGRSSTTSRTTTRGSAASSTTGRAVQANLQRAAFVVLVALYAVTWAGGAPAVQTALTHDVLEEVSRL